MSASTAPGLSLVTMDVPAEIEARFNHLYDTEHLAEVLAVPGVVGGRRYQAVEGTPRYQAVYDLESAAVVTSPAFREMAEQPGEWTQQIRPHFYNYHRRVLTQIYPDAVHTPPAPERVGGVLLVGLSVPPERDEEFNVWYNTEHLPFLAAVPGVLRARRFASLDDSRKYLAVYELADPEVPRSTAFQKAAQTPWTARQRTWFEFWLRVRSRAVTPARVE
jgi:hypothetical protein